MANRFQYEEELRAAPCLSVFRGFRRGEDLGAEALLPLLEEGGTAPCVCKIDCLKTGDGALFQAHGATLCDGSERGHSARIIFLVSNLPELWDWADRLKRDTLVIETAGLCHRCSPATQHMTAGCVLDCTASCRASGQLGQCSPRRTLWCSPRSTWSPRRNWRSSPGRSGRSTPERRFFRWTVWRAMEPTFWPGGCWTGLRAAALRGHSAAHHAQRGLLLLRGRAACGQRIPAGRGGQDQLEEAEVCSL